MTYFEALILGIIQGLTEFLPVSSSGHIEIGKAILGVEMKEDLTFTVVVHGATVLSTLVVFRKDIYLILKEALKFEVNDSNRYLMKIGVSMIPVLIVGLFFKDQIESLFFGNVPLVGVMLLVTAALLSITYYAKPQKGGVTFGKALLIGIMQAVAVIPGISRSGATISTALIAGVDKEEATRFSFLMVLIPILGANFLDILKNSSQDQYSTQFIPLAIGFIAAFLSGWWACSSMLKIVKRGKLIYFAIYCALAGITSIIVSVWM